MLPSILSILALWVPWFPAAPTAPPTVEVRVGPGTSYPVLAEIAEPECTDIDTDAGPVGDGWYQLDGDGGWVRNTGWCI